MSDIAATAADWLVRLSDEDAPVTPQERAEFEAWVAADPRHRESVERMQGLVGRLRDVPPQAAHGALDAYQRNDGDSSNWSSLAKVLSLALAMTLSLWQLAPNRPLQALLADERSGVGEWRQLTLADNSRLQLGPNSAVNLHFDGMRREIELVRGELLIDVAPDAQHALFVQTDLGSFMALGTRFTVHRDDDASLLRVLESKVLASAKTGNSAHQAVVVAGQQVIAYADRLGAPTAIDAASLEHAWHARQLVANGEPLTQVLAALNRYHRGHLTVDDEARLAQLKVFAVLPLDDPDRALQLLQESLPIRISRLTSWWVTVAPQ